MTARLVVVLMLALVTGCGKPDGRTPVYPTKGSVFYEGKPAAGAVVVLHPLSLPPAGTPLPRARVSVDGSFVLTTYVTGDGAPAGEYAVSITWRQPMEHPEQEGPDLLPARYGEPKASGLKATVEPRPNQLQPIRVSRKP